MLVLAIIDAGGIFTGTNPSYTSAELVHHLQASRTRFVFSGPTPDLLERLVESARQTNIPKQNIWIFDNDGIPNIPFGLQPWDSLLTHGDEDWVRFDALEPARSTIAARFFSSGTTGLPKAVEITHHNMLAQHTLVFEAHPRPHRVSEAYSAIDGQLKLSRSCH